MYLTHSQAVRFVQVYLTHRQAVRFVQMDLKLRDRPLGCVQVYLTQTGC